jgi:nucleoside-diphosphate-sugar epimerase
VAIPDRPVLITGGAGFIGSYVARTLMDRGRSVCHCDVGSFSTLVHGAIGHQPGGGQS